MKLRLVDRSNNPMLFPEREEAGKNILLRLYNLLINLGNKNPVAAIE